MVRRVLAFKLQKTQGKYYEPLLYFDYHNGNEHYSYHKDPVDDQTQAFRFRLNINNDLYLLKSRWHRI